MIYQYIVLLLYVKYAVGVDREMTISVAPGTRDCFFEHGKDDQVIDIEYQVIDGGHGDLDISFELADPSGRILYADFKKSENIHRFKVKLPGDYRMCFDNTFSRLNKKTVFFEIIIENENGQQDDIWNKDLLEGLTPEEFYDMKVEDIQNIITKVRLQLQKARQTQDILKSIEARDRNVAEENYFRVNVWSGFQLILMVAVGGLQVFMVRNLFNTESKINSVWKKVPYISSN